jgi:hypothetical protein
VLKAAVISTVYAPFRELLMFVHYHLNIGIDELILFFDDPIDEAMEVLSQYRNVSTIACSSEYWLKKVKRKPDFIEERQIINVNEGVQIAIKKNCDWIIHIDSDELINPLENIKSILANCKAEALRFSLMEAISERKQYKNIFLPTAFKRKATKFQIVLAECFGCSNAIFYHEYFRGHTASKMAIKISEKKCQIGIHGPKDMLGTVIIKKTNKIRLLHYDCVGFDDWNSKWRRRLGGYGSARNIRGNRYKQFQKYIRASIIGEKALSRVYHRLHIIPKREKNILRILGMLASIKLDEMLFKYRDRNL